MPRWAKIPIEEPLWFRFLRQKPLFDCFGLVRFAGFVPHEFPERWREAFHLGSRL